MYSNDLSFLPVCTIFVNLVIVILLLFFNFILNSDAIRDDSLTMKGLVEGNIAEYVGQEYMDILKTKPITPNSIINTLLDAERRSDGIRLTRRMFRFLGLVKFRPRQEPGLVRWLE